MSPCPFHQCRHRQCRQRLQRRYPFIGFMVRCFLVASTRTGPSSSSLLARFRPTCIGFLTRRFFFLFFLFPFLATGSLRSNWLLVLVLDLMRDLLCTAIQFIGWVLVEVSGPVVGTTSCVSWIFVFGIQCSVFRPSGSLTVHLVLS